MRLNERFIRALRQQKGTRTLKGEGVPDRKDGRDGDFSLRKTQNGVKLYAKYSGVWYAFSPDSDVDTDENVLSVDDTKTVETNGSIKLTGGFMIQWGTIVTGGTTGDETFPTTFPNACVAVLLVPVEDDADHKWIKLRSKNSSSFEWHVSHADADINWLAIGN